MRRGSIAIAGVAAICLAVAGCGSSSLDTTTKHGDKVNASVDKAASAKVPQALKDKGTITIGSDASYAPSEFLAGDGKTVQGFDVDLFDAVAAKLGLKTKWVPAGFDTIIAGVNSGKYDIGVSSFTINPERKQQVTMISYFNAGTQWATAPGNPKKVDPNKPCGLNIAVQSATVQQTDDLPPKEKACKAEGKPVHEDPYEKQDEATAAVASGKDDAMLADSPVIAYAVQQSKGKLQAIGDIYDAAPYGYVVKKDQTDFADAIVLALKSLQQDGGYEKSLKNWGVEAGAIDSFAVNP